MHVILCLSAVFSCFVSSYAVVLPSFIRPCSASDPALSACLAAAAQAAVPAFADGVPALGVARLDPVQLGTIPIDNPALKIEFTDTVVTGLKGARINAFTMNPRKGKATLDFTANVTLKAHYDMDGQILILPIRGNGKATIKITNLNVVVKYDFESKDGHWVVPRYKDSYSMDHAHFKFTNLFNGNTQLADTTLAFMNQSWSIIMQEIAPPAVEQIIRSCVDEVRKLFAAVPENQLISP